MKNLSRMIGEINKYLKIILIDYCCAGIKNIIKR